MARSMESCRKAAEEAARAKDDEGVQGAWLAALAWPTVVEDAAGWREVFGALARAWPREDRPLFAAWKHLAGSPADGAGLFRAGFELLERGVPGPAATLLKRAYDSRRGDEEYFSEFIVALEALDLHAEALRALHDVDNASIRSSFTWRYLVAFNTLVTGDLAGARPHVEALGTPSDDEFAAMAEELRTMLARADALKGTCPLDVQDLRGWHAVTTGGLLLATQAADRARMKGRYGRVEDSVALRGAGLAGLARALETLGVRSPRVWHASDPHSAVLAGAAGQLLGVEVAPLPAGGTLEPGLLVAWDLDGLPEAELEALQWHRPGQVLWVHGACWTDEPPFAGDLVTLLHDGFRANEALLGADAATAVVAAARTHAAADDDARAVTSVSGVMKAGGGMWAVGQVKGERARQRTDSPVRSERATG